MVNLIYHTDESRSGGRSPFDEAIRELTAGEDVLLASPYINLNYLESILADAASWRILTDMEAWLGSERSETRSRIREFVAQHREDVHDVRDLHAKAIIASESALVGSANFTRKGLAGRDELAVSLDEPELVKELRDWFDELWSNSSSVVLDELDEFINTSPSASRDVTRQPTASISSDASKVRSTLAPGTEWTRKASESSEDSNAHRRLVDRVSAAPNRQWIDRHFDLVEDPLSTAGLSNDDQILVTSIPKSDGINVTINNRYVLTIMRKARDRTEFIVSENMNGLNEFAARAIEQYQFNDRTGTRAPYFLTFEDGLTQITDPSFRRGWMAAVLDETNDRYERAPKRDHHEPAVYRAAVDYDYRRRILDKAF